MRISTPQIPILSLHVAPSPPVVPHLQDSERRVRVDATGNVLFWAGGRRRRQAVSSQPPSGRHKPVLMRCHGRCPSPQPRGVDTGGPRPPLRPRVYFVWCIAGMDLNSGKSCNLQSPPDALRLHACRQFPSFNRCIQGCLRRLNLRCAPPIDYGAHYAPWGRRHPSLLYHKASIHLPPPSLAQHEINLRPGDTAGALAPGCSLIDMGLQFTEYRGKALAS